MAAMQDDETPWQARVSEADAAGSSPEPERAGRLKPASPALSLPESLVVDSADDAQVLISCSP